MNKKIVAYVRVSTTKQLDGEGPIQQKSDIMAWAAQTGTRIDEWALEDETGTTEDREEILRLKRMAERGELGKLVMTQMDRLGREMVVALVLERDFKRLGVQLIYVKQSFDDTPMGVAMRQMSAVFAELQKTEWQSRMKTCRRVSVARKGGYGGGVPAYGYESVGDAQLELVPGETKLVARTFALHEEGSNFSQIARILTREGFRTRKGTKIAPMQVSRILEREQQYRAKKTFNHVELDEGVNPTQPAVLK